MSNSLFNEFEPVSAKQWKQKIQFDLKGADYNDTLVWTSNEGIQVKPFYHADDFKTTPKLSGTQASQFKICDAIFVQHAGKSNKNAISAINSGAESLKFIIPSEAISIENLLKNIDLDNVSIHFELQFLSEKFIKNISVIPAKTGIHINTDIIGNLSKTGNWFSNLKEDFSKFETVVTTSKSFSIDLSLYQNAGANMVQQLAYALAHANEYFNHLENAIPSKSNTQITVTFNASVGTNYFFEIAKLRALRLLFDTISSAYSIDYNCHIFTTPTKRNKAIYDYNTNMLRTTTECMCAILGGSDTICNVSYDAVFHKKNEFGTRIARNQLLILKHESYFDAVANPSDGSYYIETLTHQLAEKALILFKDIEVNGGFLKQLKNNTIQRKIKESAAKEQEQFNLGEEIILGSNKHPNKNDKMRADLELYPFVKKQHRKTLIEPIIEKRLTENLEQERLKKE
ncbi:methylmalonyl-CoA mutase subunit beta [Algibacter sp. 2305UL17-15]|uniref:methylmalonyl-CoA mutase subunit beta n=1 Tax=Algibacter sp. 2305UL17-15 TaxID=3231268 RepID=UPI0034587137